MYEVTKTVQVRLPNGRSVVLQAGPRGIRQTEEGPDDLDAKLIRALGRDTLEDLIADGTIREV